MFRSHHARDPWQAQHRTHIRCQPLLLVASIPLVVRVRDIKIEGVLVLVFLRARWTLPEAATVLAGSAHCADSRRRLWLVPPGVG